MNYWRKTDINAIRTVTYINAVRRADDEKIMQLINNERDDAINILTPWSSVIDWPPAQQVRVARQFGEVGREVCADRQHEVFSIIVFKFNEHKSRDSLI